MKRPKAYVIPETYEAAWVKREQVLYVEQALRGFNEAGWTINDPLKVAIDPDRYEPFILDLSLALPLEPRDKMPEDGERDLFLEWAREIPAARGIVKLREDAREALSDTEWRRGRGKEYRETHQWIYGSAYRPINASWARIPDAVYRDADYSATGMHTWVQVPGKLDADLVKSYELQWGWGPIVYEK